MIDLKEMKTVAFGPVPSRRLGRSLGINNIPPKFCSYSCIYCQIGKTINLTTGRRSFHKPKDIFKQVKRKINEVIQKKELIDYLTFVADGEPTLDSKIQKEITLLKQLAIPIAVITNSSLIWQKEIKEELLEADLVSLKIDAVKERVWKRINRPHKDLKLNTILEGIIEFADYFGGTIITETMLVDGINYGDEFEKIAEFLQQLKRLDKAYLAIPTRPPTEKWVSPAREETVNSAFQVFTEKLGSNKVEYLIGYEGNAFSSTGKVEKDLLSITSVHPMRKEAVEEILRDTNTSWSIIDNLLLENKLVELDYAGKIYYMRKLGIRKDTK
jgi:wyosine [tRNA(Phe)-imidazoG37] synthetase (radical SAM superfamily)